MSMQFWMLSGATVGAAAALGLGLGLYVTSPQKPLARPSEDMESVAYDTQAPVAPIDARGPAVVHCTGCGPTLEERRFAADRAGLDSDGMIDGSRDPVVQDYMRQPDSAEPVLAAEAPPPPILQRLPPRVERFAAGDDVPPPRLVPVVAGAPAAPVAIEPVAAGAPPQ